MANTIGIRREDKSEWERRVPITPRDAADLRQAGVDIIVQTSPIRAFDDEEFSAAGIPVQRELAACPVILGIKEMPQEIFEPGKAYVFFAHVIKGQPYNMDMLRRLLELGCTLIDYERIVDDQNRRLIFFGWHAGVAGMINTLWALGQRLAWEGIPNPLDRLRQTRTYRDLDEARIGLTEARARIETEGLPAAVTPLVIGVAGYGNVSRGAQEMLDLLPTIEIDPREVPALVSSGEYSRHHVYKAVFHERHLVEPVEPGAVFHLQDYYDHPEKYRGVFESYLPYLNVVVNAIFWTERYPRLVTKEGLKALFAGPGPRLRVIGDISCDVEGAIEATVKATEPGDPLYVYDPRDGSVADGHEGRGVVIMAVDILPSELPREASADFSRVLKPYIPALARCDLAAPLQDLDLPPEIKRAVIAHQGHLAPDYEYIHQYLDE
ncbi:MAG: bifunctional lysine ketoglutarate reductase /saccharopine dehydrogenase family protein [Anaerolineae bacterium]|jgi:saccharopine dehydrogenase (NAD+, L-lysine forming)